MLDILILFVILSVFPPARTATALGWLVLVGMMMWAACFVHTRHSGGSMVRMAEVRSRILAPVTSVTSRVPGWRQEDLLAVRTRVQAQFRQVQITIKQLFEGYV